MQPLHYDPPTEPWLDIIYQDRDLLAVNKPCGLLSNPGRAPEHHDSALSRVRADFPNAEIVNRLDRATSGLVIIALRKKAERALKSAFAERAVTKVYRARVWGQLAEPVGEITLPLICDWPNRPLQKVCLEHGKPAITRYRTLQQDADSALVELYPLTGRSHQLRVHMLAMGHPILGDDFYAPDNVLAASDRLLLHALNLTLPHPYHGQPITLTAPSDCPRLAL